MGSKRSRAADLHGAGLRPNDPLPIAAHNDLFMLRSQQYRPRENRRIPANCENNLEAD
jgi:hypothetical protein